MGALAKLTRIFLGENEVEIGEDAIPRLRELYTGTIQRSRQLTRHAELAPHEAGRAALQQLAADEESLAEKLKLIILGLRGFPGEARKELEPTGALNYWGRLVQDLEAHREAAKQLIEESTRFADELPALAEQLRLMARDVLAHGERLRTLIARSDPQALD